MRRGGKGDAIPLLVFQDAPPFKAGSFTFTMVVAFSKECWQILLLTRHFSLKDIFVDGGATLLAMLVVGGSRWTREQPEHRKRAF